MLAAACEQFLGKTVAEIREVAQETLEGHQRAIMGNMTVEEIYKDRKKFSKAVFEVASSDLVNMGISVAEEQRVAGRLLNDIKIAKAKRDFELQNASYQKEVQARKAESEMAYELQAAKTRQRIKEEEMQILVVERTQQIQVEELENERQQRHLDATVRKPAEAERFRLERLAEADRLRLIAESEAEAERIRLRGLAEAEALNAVAKAEAEQMMKKAEAWQAYKGAARLEMVLQALPKLAAEISAPLAQCEKVTMVSTGDGDIGVSRLTGEVLQLMTQLPKVVQSMTGVDLFKTAQSV
ncbi:unnamed protein product [Echinostoma caproni]|uniref:Flot domain-containing protein n=1 Tax=Echinostoma caproni TaxID=27848 RepID=A0A183B4G0_9TREM|nr:unnamed protein product [Echinostoma caproni]